MWKRLEMKHEYLCWYSQSILNSQIHEIPKIINNEISHINERNICRISWECNTKRGFKI